MRGQIRDINKATVLCILFVTMSILILVVNYHLNVSRASNYLFITLTWSKVPADEIYSYIMLIDSLEAR